MLVYVKNKNGNWLMPCKPAKARKLLRDKKAKVVCRCPFTIQLNWDCEEHTQEVTLGIDKGASYTGFCALSEDKVLMSGIVNHRRDIKDKMTGRAQNRRQRRSRLWYRKPRFLNRSSSKRSGRIPPSIKTNVEEVIRVVKKIPLPIANIVVEDVLVDIARISNPELKGSEYQKKQRLSENLRMACLLRDGFKCQHCGVGSTRLEAHHIVPRSEQGKDSIHNLITLCSKCHAKVHEGTITLSVTGMSGLKDIVAQRSMQGKTYMYKELDSLAPVSLIYGYETSEYRKSLGLEKDHDIDAFCIANYYNRYPLTYSKDSFYSLTFRARQTRRQFFDQPKKGVGRVRYQVNDEVEGLRKGDIVKVKKKWVKQINSIYSNGRVAFKRVKGEPSSSLPKDCKLLVKQKTIVWNTVKSY